MSASFNWPPSSLTTATIGILLTDPLNGSYINTNPLHKTRPLTLEVFNATNALIYQDTVNAAVAPGTDRYVATVPLDWQRDWSPGGNATVVLVKVKLDYTLFKQVAGFYLIKAGTDTALPDTSVRVGDVNQDNAVNITDYNLMMQCYSDLQPPKGPCSASLKRASDLNDDGYVNGIDYNLMLRILQNQGGS
jgi:dockerin type I repeat protein